MRPFFPVAVLLAAGVAVIALSMDWISIPTENSPRAEQAEPTLNSEADLNIVQSRVLSD